jgi:hypothetical protein
MGYSVFPAAASGPTLAEITAAGNSAGWGATATKGPLDVDWTYLGYTSGDGVTSVTISSLTGYKQLKIVMRGIGLLTTQSYVRMRLNSDSGTNYVWYNTTAASNSYQNGDRSSYSVNYIPVQDLGGSANLMSGEINITNATSTSHKNIEMFTSGFNSTAHVNVQTRAIYASTSAISSITLYSGSLFSNPSTAGFYVYGAN